MAHAAEIDNQGIVKRVIVVNKMYGNLTCEQWCEKTYGGRWLKTSYNTRGGIHYGKDKKPDSGTPFRMNFAGIGFTYDEKLDAFISPKPYPSWVLNKKTCEWEAPVPYPKDAKKPYPFGEYDWDENTINWKKL